MRRTMLGILAICWLLICGVAAAEDAPPLTGKQKLASFAGQGQSNLLLRLHLGGFRGENSPELQGEKVGFAVGVEASLFPKECISYFLEWFETVRDLQTPASAPSSPWGSTGGETTLTTNALILGVRANYPDDRMLRIHASGGVGYFRTEMAVDRTLMGIPGESSDSDSALGLQAGAGIEWVFTGWVIGLDYRYWLVRGGRFDTFGVDNVKAGGSLYTPGVGWYFF